MASALAGRATAAPWFHEYIAGFIDGDGSIRVAKPNNERRRSTPVILVAQSCQQGEAPELAPFKEHWGGTVRERKLPKKRRRGWVWRLKEQDRVAELLAVIHRHGITKAPQAARAAAYMRGPRDDCAEVARAISEAKRSYHEVTVDPARITDAYLSGLFAADGSVSLKKSTTGAVSLHASITQRSCVPLLEGIKARLGGAGHVDRNRLYLSGSAAFDLLQRVSPYLLHAQKGPQAALGIKFFERRSALRRKHASNEEREKDIEMMTEMRRMKKV